MKQFLVVALLARSALYVFGFLAACCPASADNTTNSDMFSLVDEQVYDAPIKTQIEQYIVALSVPSRDELEAEVRERYRAASIRRGFRYHNRATNIYIYIYGDEEKARNEHSLWIAMTAKNYYDTGDPKIIINENRLTALSAPPERRFGLSESDRQKIFTESGAAEDRAMQEAMQLVPGDDFQKEAELEGKLRDKYKAEIAARYGITDDQLLEIQVEGITKGWSMR